MHGEHSLCIDSGFYRHKVVKAARHQGSPCHNDYGKKAPDLGWRFTDAWLSMAGNGDKGFCAGGDVAGVIREVRAGGPRRFVYGDAFFDVEYTLDLLIHTYPKPLISWAHGVCMGGGVGLTVGASHRIVSERSRIAMPEIHIGLFPDVGGGWFLNRLPGGVGTVMALTGMIVDEADAIHAGLADYFVPEHARGAFIDSLLALDWSGEPRADRERLTRFCLDQHKRWREGLPVPKLRQYAEAIRWIAAQPTVVEVRDALLAAADEDPYFRVAADNLAKGSPTTAHVTFEYLRRTRQMSIAEVLALPVDDATPRTPEPDIPTADPPSQDDPNPGAPPWSANR